MFKSWIVASTFALSTLAGSSILHAGDVSQDDKQFAAAAASGGMLEVRLGQYASDNAANKDVKAFGEHMVDDHTKANDQLKTIATEKSIDLPKELNEEDQKVLDRLEKLKGAEFDKAYMAQMIEDHNKDIAAFQKEASDGSEATVKAFADSTLPTLKHHLEMAKDVNGKL